MVPRAIIPLIFMIFFVMKMYNWFFEKTKIWNSRRNYEHCPKKITFHNYEHF